MILVLTNDSDEHVAHVERLLQQRKTRSVRVDTNDFGRRIHPTVAVGTGFQQRLRIGDLQLAAGDLTGVWYRRTTPKYQAPDVVDPRIRQLVELEFDVFIRNFLGAADVPWFPGSPSAVTRAENKLLQLRLATEVGLAVPRTLVTVDPEEALNFINQCGLKVVTKLAAPGPFVKTFPDMARYCNPVSKRDLVHLRSIKDCPVMLQEEVPKRFELRVTIVGQEVFAVTIDSQANQRTRTDWRRYDMSNTPHRPGLLPAEISRRCLDLLDRLELSYGALDFVVDDQGRYVFLECNPSGQYLWLERATGLAISAAVCDVLEGRTSPATSHHLREMAV